MPPLRLRLFTVAAFAFLLLTFIILSGEAQTRKEADDASLQLTVKERVSVFEDTWQTIYERYYDPHFNGVDWKQEHDDYLPLIEKAQNNDEFYRALKAMVSSLHDAHTRVFSPDEKSDWERPKFISVGITVHKIEDEPAVFSVERGSQAEKLGIKPGYILTAVNDQPINDVIARLQTIYNNSSTERSSELRVYSKIFYGKKDTTVKADFLDADGQKLSVTLKRYEEYTSPQLIYHKLPGNIGYVEFNGFWPETATEFEHAIKALHDTHGLIIDLRENGGGAAFSAAQMASYLFPKQTSLGKFTGRNGKVIEPKTEPVDKTYLG